MDFFHIFSLAPSINFELKMLTPIEEFDHILTQIKNLFDQVNKNNYSNTNDTSKEVIWSFVSDFNHLPLSLSPC